MQVRYDNDSYIVTANHNPDGDDTSDECTTADGEVHQPFNGDQKVGNAAVENKVEDGYSHHLRRASLSTTRS